MPYSSRILANNAGETTISSLVLREHGFLEFPISAALSDDNRSG